MKKQRIWELDALRGLCIIGMVIVHLVYDIRVFTDVKLSIPEWFFTVQEYGHLFFVLISGICVTLGSRCIKRGLIVCGCALVITAVTVVMDFSFGVRNVRIWFGILHLLGVCMLLYPLFRKLPSWALAIIGIAFVALGYWFTTFRVDVNYLFPLGLRSGKIFTGSDYFPIFPGLGSFLIGASIGKSAYRKKQSLMPKVRSDFFVIRGLSFIGRHSLEIYMLHQPIVYGIVMLICA